MRALAILPKHAKKISMNFHFKTDVKICNPLGMPPFTQPSNH